MKKKLFTLLLAGCMVLSLAACGKEETKETEETTDSAEEIVEIDRSALGTSTLTELGEYKGMTYVPYDATVTDEELELQVQYMLSVSEIPQETVTETSFVNIDYVGKKDGVAFDGGTASGVTLSIENSGYIPGFAESIVGMKVGETKDCPMTFPEEYGVEELNGADVVFTITVNDCYVRGELNDEFAKSEGYDNLDALYAGVRADYEAYEQRNAQADMEYQVIEGVIANSTFEMNEDEIAVYVADLESEYEAYAYQYGYDLESYVTIASGMTMEEFNANNREIAIYRIKSPLVLAAIAEAEGLVVPEEEYAERAQEYVDYYQKNSLEDLEETYTKETIMLQLTADIALEHIVEHAVAVAEEN